MDLDGLILGGSFAGLAAAMPLVLSLVLSLALPRTGPAPALEAVQLADARKQPLAVLYTTSDSRSASDLADQLGCTMAEAPTRPYLKVSAMQASSVPGVFTAGDLCSPMINAVLSGFAGMMAGTAADRLLIFSPELAPARAAS